MTEDRVREIVREELAAIAAERGPVNDAENIAYKALTIHKVEAFMDEQHFPDDVREAIFNLIEGMLG